MLYFDRLFIWGGVFGKEDNKKKTVSKLKDF